MEQDLSETQARLDAATTVTASAIAAMRTQVETWAANIDKMSAEVRALIGPVMVAVRRKFR